MSRNVVEYFIRAVDQASAIFERMGANADRNLRRAQRSSDAASKSLNYLKTAVVGAAAGFGAKGAWNWLIDTNSKMEQAKVGFETMLGSATKAQKFLEDLQQFAAKTPFEFTQLRTAATRMLAFGFTAEQVIPTLTAVGDATSALGLGAEGVNRVILALGQMKAKAKVSAEEMMQLTEAGIPAWDILAKAMGKSTAEVMKLSEKGTIPADKAIQALLQGMEERFPGMMEKQSKTLGGMISNLKDWSEIAGRTLGEGIFNQVKPGVEKALGTLNQLKASGDLQRWGQNIGEAFRFAVDHARDFIAITSAVGTYMVFTRGIQAMATALAVYRASQFAATLATNGFTAALLKNPLGLLAVGLSLIVGSLVAYKLGVFGATESTAQLDDQTQKVVNSFVQAKAAADEVTTSVERKAYAMQILNKTTAELNSALPDILRFYGEEALAIEISTGKVSENTNAYLKNLSIKAAAAQAELQNLEDLQFYQRDFLNKQKNPYNGKPGYSWMDVAAGFVDPELGSKVDKARNNYNGLSAALNAANSAVTKIYETGGSGSPSKIDFGAAGADKAKEKIISLSSVFSQLSDAVGTESKTALIEARSALQDIISEVNEVGATNIAGKLEETLSLLPDAVNDKTGASGRKLIDLLYNILNEASDITGEAAYKTQNQYELALSRISDRFKKMADDAAEESRRMEKAMSDSLQRVGNIYSQMNADIIKANEDYNNKVADVNKKVQEDVQKLNDDFQNSLKDTATKLRDWAGIFDEVPELVKDSMSKMTKNLRDQVDRFDLFYQMIGNLSKRGVDKGLVEELRQMGPKAANQVMALYQATDDELEEYVDLWKTSGELAGDEAEDQLKDTKYKMLVQQQKIRDDARDQLNKLYDEWQKSLTNIRNEASQKLSDVVADAKEKGTKFMTDLISSIKEKYPEFSAIIDQITGKMDINPSLYQQHINYFGGMEQYANVIKQKESQGQSLDDPQAAAQFKRDHPELFGGSVSNGGSGLSAYAQSVRNSLIASGSVSYSQGGGLTSGDSAESSWWSANFGYVPSSVSGSSSSDSSSDSGGDSGSSSYWFHDGGEVTRQGKKSLGPRDVPIIAQEGEMVITPQTGTTLSADKLLSKLDQLISLMKDSLSVKFDSLQKVENQNIYSGQDSEQFARDTARNIVILARG